MSRNLDPKLLVQGCLLILAFVFLVFFYHIVDFRGLSKDEGMAQADIARSLAVGDGFSTNVHLPREMSLVREQAGLKPSPGNKAIDSSHAPVYPFLTSLCLRLGDPSQTLPDGETIFALDRIIAAQSLIFFVLSIAVSAALIARLFDTRIALATIVLMILCETMWLFTTSGLAQMHLLFFFNLALLFLHEAYTRACTEGGKSPFLPSLLSGVAFALLGLTHWLALWPFWGTLLVIAVAFPKRVTIALGVAIPVVSLAAWGARNISVWGDPFGMGKETLYSALTRGSRAPLLREYSTDIQFSFDGLPTRLAVSTVGQLETLYVFLGAAVVAPLFFIAILHHYKKTSVGMFRWIVLSAWIFAAIGMSLFGINNDEPIAFNQIHILFMPVMSAFGLALLSILWGRLQLRSNNIFALRGHIIIAILVSALPLLFTLPKKISSGIYFKASGGMLANWPPYYPPVFSQLGEQIEEGEFVVTDSPAALAWYGNCPSIWLPLDAAQLVAIGNDLEETDRSIIGILLTPKSTFLGLSNEILSGTEEPWARLILRAAVAQVVPGADPLARAPDFPYRVYHRLFPRNEMVFFGKKRLW